MVIYRAEGSHTALTLSIAIIVSLRATLNGTEVAGSQSSLVTTIPALTTGTFPITSSFILDATATDTLKIQFTATSNTSRLDTAGAGITTTSTSLS